ASLGEAYQRDDQREPQTSPVSKKAIYGSTLAKESPFTSHEDVKMMRHPLLSLPRRGGEKERGHAIINLLTVSFRQREKFLRNCDIAWLSHLQTLFSLLLCLPTLNASRSAPSRPRFSRSAINPSSVRSIGWECFQSWRATWCKRFTICLSSTS